MKRALAAEAISSGKMKLGLLSLIVCACSASGKPAGTTGANKPAINSPACRDAYTDYESRWRLARTEELDEFVAGDPDVLEEILYYELGTLPSRAEVDKLREIYAVVDVFLWDAPMPRALAAADTAIERCGEQAARPRS